MKMNGIVKLAILSVTLILLIPASHSPRFTPTLIATHGTNNNLQATHANDFNQASDEGQHGENETQTGNQEHADNDHNDDQANQIGEQGQHGENETSTADQGQHGQNESSTDQLTSTSHSTAIDQIQTTQSQSGDQRDTGDNVQVEQIGNIESVQTDQLTA